MSADEAPVILDLIRRLKADRRHTLLLVEHKMDVVRELADRIIVLHNGRLVADGAPAEVMASDVVREAYLGGAAPMPVEAGTAFSQGASSSSEVTSSSTVSGHGVSR
jgi:branched-chain amino acid transport system ATP-binding protein